MKQLQNNFFKAINSGLLIISILAFNLNRLNAKSTFYSCTYPTLQKKIIPASFSFNQSTDTSVIFFFNDLCKNQRLIKELNWDYQIPDLIAPDNENKGWNSFVTLNFDTIKNNVYYDKEDVFNITLKNNILILEKNNQRSINDFTTYYKIIKIKKRKKVALNIDLICYSKQATEHINVTYVFNKNNWTKTKYKKETKERTEEK